MRSRIVRRWRRADPAVSPDRPERRRRAGQRLYSLVKVPQLWDPPRATPLITILVIILVFLTTLLSRGYDVATATSILLAATAAVGQLLHPGPAQPFQRAVAPWPGSPHQRE